MASLLYRLFQIAEVVESRKFCLSLKLINIPTRIFLMPFKFQFEYSRQSKRNIILTYYIHSSSKYHRIDFIKE